MTEKILKAASMEDAVYDNFTEVAVEEQPTEVQAEIPVETEQVTETIENTETPTENIQEENTETQPTETEVPAEKIVEVEKIVEKIVEKQPEFKDEYSKTLYDAIISGNDEAVKKHLDEKYRDYQSMSDYDVVKEGLKRDNPDWTDKRIELEFKTKYDVGQKKDLDAIDADTYPEDYEKAQAFNESIERREELLAMQAEDYRIKLNAQKKNAELPKITSQEQQPEVTQPTAEEIAEATRQWEAGVEAEVPKISDLSFKVNGEDVTYKVTDEDRKELASTMKNFNVADYLTNERKWFDENGNPNIKNISEDVYKFKNIEKMLGSVATQIKTATKKEVIAKDIKNLDLEGRSPSTNVTAKSFADAALDA